MGDEADGNASGDARETLGDAALAPSARPPGTIWQLRTPRRLRRAALYRAAALAAPALLLLLLGSAPWARVQLGMDWALLRALPGGGANATALRARGTAAREPSAWAAQVRRDLAAFRAAGVSAADVAAAAQVKAATWRLLIHSNRLYLHPSPLEQQDRDRRVEGHPHVHMQQLIKVLCAHKLPDMELVLNWGDFPKSPKSLPPLPIFSWTKDSNHHDLMFPYWSWMFTPPNASMVDSEPRVLPSPVSYEEWHRKNDTAIWRGGTHGGDYSGNGTWRRTPRGAVVVTCNRRPDLCDAQFASFTQASPKAKAEIIAAFGEHPRIHPDEYFKHKVVIVVDGNGPPSSRSTTVFMGGSLVAWQESPVWEFWYSALRPYVHYLPLSRELGDLEAQLEWARSNPVAAHAMVANAQAFMRGNFNTRSVNAYLKQLLIEYAGLLTYKPQLTPEYEANRIWLAPPAEQLIAPFLDGQCEHWESVPPPAPANASRAAAPPAGASAAAGAGGG